MTSKTAKAGNPIYVIDAIYHRRSVRDYKPSTIDDTVIHALLDAAVHAPTAMHEEPWAFAVIKDKSLLNRLSESAKELLRAEATESNSSQSKHVLELIDKPGFDIFYNAGTLIVIYNKMQRATGVADCWLAAQNLMLAAYAKGIGSCVIGLSIQSLNTPGWKKRLGIPLEMTAIAPIIVGLPAGETPPVPRKQPEIITWKR